MQANQINSKFSGVLAAAALALGALVAAPAQAGEVYWHVGIDAPVDAGGHVRTRVGNYRPQPAPVVVAPAPVVVQPVHYVGVPVVHAPVAYRHGHHHGGWWRHRAWHRHGWHGGHGGHHGRYGQGHGGGYDNHGDDHRGDDRPRGGHHGR